MQMLYLFSILHLPRAFFFFWHEKCFRRNSALSTSFLELKSRISILKAKHDNTPPPIQLFTGVPMCQVHKFDEIKIASICKNAVIGLLSMNSCMFQPCLM